MEETYKIIKKILGEIQPVGETYEDARRGINLENTIDLVSKLIFDIEDVAKERDRIEWSMNQAGKKAYEFRNSLTEYE